MRIFGKIRVQLMVIVLICYLVPAVVLGGYMGGEVLGDLQAKTESALATGMEHSLVLTEVPAPPPQAVLVAMSILLPVWPTMVLTERYVLLSAAASVPSSLLSPDRLTCRAG